MSSPFSGNTIYNSITLKPCIIIFGGGGGRGGVTITCPPAKSKVRPEMGAETCAYMQHNLCYFTNAEGPIIYCVYIRGGYKMGKSQVQNVLPTHPREWKLYMPPTLLP